MTGAYCFLPKKCFHLIVVRRLVPRCIYRYIARHLYNIIVFLFVVCFWLLTHCCSTHTIYLWLISVDLSLPTQVHILSHFIMNGVCVRWKGRIDLDKLDGIGCLEFDEERAMVSAYYILLLLYTENIIVPRGNNINTTRVQLSIVISILRLMF